MVSTTCLSLAVGIVAWQMAEDRFAESSRFVPLDQRLRAIAVTPWSRTTAPLKLNEVADIKIERRYTVVSNHGSIEARCDGYNRCLDAVTPWSRTTAPLKHREDGRARVCYLVTPWSRTTAPLKPQSSDSRCRRRPVTPWSRTTAPLKLLADCSLENCSQLHRGLEPRLH